MKTALKKSAATLWLHLTAYTVSADAIGNLAIAGVALWLSTMASGIFDAQRSAPMHRAPAAHTAVAPMLPPSATAGLPAANTPPSAKAPESRFHPIIVRAANRYKVDPALVKAIIKAESGYNARAISKKGAVGLMQLMPRTAEALGVKDSFDPEHNINGGVKYFRKLMDQFEGDVRLALAAYNAGSRKVRHYRGVPPFKATQYYVKKVFRYYQIYKRQADRMINNA